MTNKFKFIVGAVAAFAFTFVMASTASAAYTHSTTLKMGSTGSQVMALQQTLNTTSCKVATSGAGSTGMETSTFAGKTKAAVQCFQLANALTADGVVGPMTGAKISAIVVTDTTLPSGCTSTSGYSSTTGIKCDSTGGVTLPAGCSTTAGYSSTTGVKCSDGSTSTNTGALQGGAGDINVSSTQSDVEDDLKEGENDVQVLGFEVEADGSDVAVTSVRVTFASNIDEDASERLEDYIDEVTVWYDGKQVGSADVEDFDRERGTPDTYTETISLSNAVVREGDEEKFYVAVSGASSIDDTDTEFGSFDVELETLRFTDATGAILTYDLHEDEIDNTITFNDASADDDLSINSSSANPDAMTVRVDEDDESDEFLALAFKMEVDEDSSDVTIYDLPIHFVIANGGTDATNFDDVIDSVMVKIGSDEYEADLDGNGNLSSGAGSADYYIDLDDGDFVIDAGDEVEVKVYVTFRDQDDHYAEGTRVTASLDASDIEAEGEDDDIDTSDLTNRTGGTLTLNTSAGNVDVTDVSQRTTNDNNTTGVFSFTFTVDAEGGDVAVNLENTLVTVLGPANTYTAVITDLDDDAEEVDDSSFIVEEGDEVEFSIDITVDPSATGNFRVRLDSAAGSTVNETSGSLTLSA